MRDKQEFRGPVFVVGMPRSGTKLLRDIINNNKQIFIPPNESKIIPYMVRNYGTTVSRPDLAAGLDEWYASTFYQRIEDAGYTVDREDWLNKLGSEATLPMTDIIESFYQILSDKTGAAIWGDKTPTYLLHYSLLLNMYPEAKFVHIVRDVRDYCLSINKAWGKSMLRAAYRWNTSLTVFREQIGDDDSRVLHIRYEDLTENPKETMQLVCSFLGISYNAEMLQLNKPSENLGDAKGLTIIKKGNSRKWVDQLPERRLNKIEMTCTATMKRFGYQPAVYFGDQKTPGKTEQKLYKLFDGLNLLKYHTNRLGSVSKALPFILKDYRRRV